IQAGVPLVFNLTSAGTYKLVGTVTAPHDGADSFYVDIDTNPARDEAKVWDTGSPITSKAIDVTWRGAEKSATCFEPFCAGFNPKTFTLAAGIHTLYVNAREQGTGIQSIQFVKNPDFANTSPVLSAIGNQTIAEGSLLSFSISAIDANNDTLTYSATGLPAGATFNSSTRSFSFTPTHAQSGSYAAIFSVDDGSGGVDSEIVVFTVTNVNRPPTANAGINQTIILPATASLSASASSDPDGTALTYLWSKISGSGTVTFSNNLSVSTNAAFGSQGIYIIQVLVSDGSLSSTDRITIAVNETLPIDADSDGVFDSSDLCLNTPHLLSSQVNTRGCPKPRVTKFTVSQDLETADITALTSIDLFNAYGKVSFLNTNSPYSLVRDVGTHKDQLDIDSSLAITDGAISLDSVNLPELNKEATITLYNITVSNPAILKDGTSCSVCSIISYQDNTLVFTVPGFSTYTVVEGTPPAVPPPPPPPPSPSPLPGGGGGSTGGYYSPAPIYTPTPTPPTIEIEQLRATLDFLIAKLNALIIQAKAQGIKLPPGIENLLSKTSYRFTRDLSLGSTGDDVKALQVFLNSNGFTIATKGAGSQNSETTYFGPATKAALIRFQEAHLGEILSPIGLIKGTGVFGARTRAIVNNNNN
ncbi:MAG: PKD domain-containing protein, partial [Patescibacteria group bacterium]